MRLRRLRELIDAELAADTVDGDGVLLGLFRNLDAPIDSDDGWSELPVLDIELDLESDELDLVTSASTSRSALTLVGLSSRLAELQPTYDELRVMIEGEHHQRSDGWGWFTHSGVVGSAVDLESRRLAVTAEYEGCECELD